MLRFKRTKFKKLSAYTKLKQLILRPLNFFYDYNPYVTGMLRISISIFLIYFVFGKIITIIILLHYLTYVSRPAVKISERKKKKTIGTFNEEEKLIKGEEKRLINDDRYKFSNGLFFPNFPLYTSFLQMMMARFRRKKKKGNFMKYEEGMVKGSPLKLWGKKNTLKRSGKRSKKAKKTIY